MKSIGWAAGGDTIISHHVGIISRRGRCPEAAMWWTGTPKLKRQIKASGQVNYCPLCQRRRSP
jgi:hypothetical protein